MRLNEQILSFCQLPESWVVFLFSLKRVFCNDFREHLSSLLGFVLLPKILIWTPVEPNCLLYSWEYFIFNILLNKLGGRLVIGSRDELAFITFR